MENIFNEILGMSLDSAWLIGAVIVARLLLYKAPKYFRKILWGLVGLRLLIPFSFESALSLAPEIPSETVSRVSQQMVTTPIEQGLSFINIVAVVWVTVGVAFLGYGIISYFKLKSKIFDGVLYQENIYYSEKIESPFVCGFIKPKIYLPYGLAEETQNHVLQHEKTHIKYADHIVKVIGFVLLCVHWFNPLVWVSYFLFCKDIELSCDESVVKNYDAIGCKQYAKALLELGVNKVRLSACPVAFGEVSIKNRIKSVTNYKKAGRAFICVALCLCVVIAVCFMTEPEVKAKATVEIEKTEKTTEDVKEIIPTSNVKETEPVTESTTEATTEPIAEVVETEVVSEEERYDERDLIIVHAPEYEAPPIATTSPYVVVTNPSNSTVEIPMPSIPNLFSEDIPANDSGNSPSPYLDNKNWRY